MSHPIPLLMSLELLKHHENDNLEHQLRIGVVGMKQPLTAEIMSDFFEDPHVTAMSGSNLDVPANLQRLFLLKCFNVLWPNPDGTSIRETFLSDATSWIDAKFNPPDAQLLLAALRRQVTPDLVRAGDRFTSMIPYMPPKGDQP